MKLVARIRQLLASRRDPVEAVPLPIAVPPEHTLRRAVERPATPPFSRHVAVPTTIGGCVLEGEGIEQPIADPSKDIIRYELERLRSAGPSFVALIAPDGSYLQVAGNAKRMTVEARFKNAQSITHVVLGRSRTSELPTTVVASFGSIEVSTSEVWAAPEVSTLFAGFLQTGSVPSYLTQRDITSARP